MLMLRTNANPEHSVEMRGWHSVVLGYPVVLRVVFFGFLDTIIVVLRGGINKIACFLVRLKIFNTIYSFFSLTLL